MYVFGQVSQLVTNAVADYINETQPSTRHIEQAIESGHAVYLCQPVNYEILRGLIKANATRKLHRFETVFAPQLEQLPLIDADWMRAAELWAESSKQGKQLSDTDLLIAAVTLRLNGILVTADDDFTALPIKRENWRVV